MNIKLIVFIILLLIPSIVLAQPISGGGTSITGGSFVEVTEEDGSPS